MKRFLSWLVLIALSIAFYYLEFFFWMLAWGLGEDIYWFSESLFWVLIVCEGATAAGIVILLIVLASRMVIRASQAVWRSRNGRRYVACGFALILLNGALIITQLVRKVFPGVSGLIVSLAYGTMIAFGLALVVRGCFTAEEDGPPPTRREVLEAKLRKLDEKEAARNGAAKMR